MSRSFLLIRPIQSFFYACWLLLLFTQTSCEKALNLDDVPDDKISVFEDLWRYMDQHYSLFAEKGISWDSVYQAYLPKLSDDIPDRQFFNVLESMLATLKDGHVALISENDTAGYDNFYKAFPLNFNHQNITRNYLQNDYKTIGPVEFKIVENIGYIYYGSFSENITDEEADRLFLEMKDTKGLIIDVRNNNGGQLINANRIFSRLIKERTLVKYERTKKGKAHDDFYDPVPYYISPSSVYYAPALVLLTNRACYSACNDFALYISGLPRARIFGDQTGGGGAIPDNYILPNGWKLQYSSTVTLSPAGKSIENGIVPHQSIGISYQDEISGKDPILEKAFLSLQ
jgi:hypothetical protein